MRADLGTNPVLEGRDDLAARRVVLRIGGEDEHDVQLEADRIALYLDVALLQDVEQAHLNLAGQVRQLVDGEDAAVRPREQSVVHGQLVAKVQAPLRRLDRIDVAHHVRDRHVRRRELLDEAGVPREPGNRQAVALGGGPGAAGAADGRQWIVVNLAAGYDRYRLVQQINQPAQDSGLGLAAETEEDEVVPRQHRVHQLRNDGLVVAYDAGEERLARLELPHQVVADFLPHAAASTRADGLAEFAQSLN